MGREEPKPEQQRFRVKCAWCGKDLGPAKPGVTDDNHSVCKECERKVMGNG